MAAHRILHVLGTADIAGKAVNQIVEKLATSLDPGKYQVEACFLQSGEFAQRFRALGIRSTCMDWNGAPTSLPGAARYARLLRSAHYDLIHQHTGGRFLTRMGRIFTDASIVRHVHARATGDTVEVSLPLHLPERDATIASSRVVADNCGDPNAIVIYPGIDVNEFACTRVPGQDLILGTACRLEPVKGIATLIEAIAILAVDIPSIRLEIAGEGSLRNALEERVARQRVSANITFLGWCRNMIPVLQSWGLFVQPSLDEGFGVAVLEAMASGLPVVASDVGGLREIVEDGKTGFLVPPRDPAAFAEKIRLLLGDPDLRAAMGAAGRRRAQEEFSLTAMVRRTAEFYDRLLESA